MMAGLYPPLGLVISVCDALQDIRVPSVQQYIDSSNLASKRSCRTWRDDAEAGVVGVQIDTSHAHDCQFGAAVLLWYSGSSSFMDTVSTHLPGASK